MKKIVFLLIVVLLLTGCNQIEEVSVSNTPTSTTTPTAIAIATPTVEAASTPTIEPTPTATVIPTAMPTAKPTTEATKKPTAKPTAKPTVKPTARPTVKPTASPLPTIGPKPTPSPVPVFPKDPATCTHRFQYAPPRIAEYPTVEKEGKEFWQCMSCGYSFYEPIPKRDPKYASIPDGIMIIERNDSDVLYYAEEPWVRLQDYRTWGDLPIIKILEDKTWEVTYYNKENKKCTFILVPQYEGFGDATIRDNGEVFFS